MPPVTRYAALTITPLALLVLGAMAGGLYAVAPLVWLTLAAALVGPAPTPEAGTGDARLPLFLAAGHFAVLPLVLQALAGYGPGVPLDPAARIVLFFATASFLAQVALPAAHDLIHRAVWWQRWTGAMVYTSLGFGHHVSAHRLVHHPHLGTYSDPHTPLPGEGFWTYLRRAWSEGFAAGRAAEEEKLARHGLGSRNWRNPYWLWLGGELAFLVGAVLMAGAVGVLACLLLWLVAGGSVLMGDYLRHYGLWRQTLPSGGREAVGPHHAWAVPGAPDTPETGAPRLPVPMPSMALLAMVPPLWRRVMDPRAARATEAAAARIAADAEAEGAAAPEGATPPPPARATGRTRKAGARKGKAKASAPAPGEPHEEIADADMARAMDEAAEIDADGDLIARVQDLVNAAPEQPPERAEPVFRGPAPIEVPRATGRLKLSRPIRSSRRAALRDP